MIPQVLGRPVDGPARDLDLELLGDVGLVQGAAVFGAGVGQRRLVDLVDLIGAGRPAVCLGAYRAGVGRRGTAKAEKQGSA